MAIECRNQNHTNMLSKKVFKYAYRFSSLKTKKKDIDLVEFCCTLFNWSLCVKSTFTCLASSPNCVDLNKYIIFVIKSAISNVIF